MIPGAFEHVIADGTQISAPAPAAGGASISLAIADCVE